MFDFSGEFWGGARSRGVVLLRWSHLKDAHHFIQKLLTVLSSGWGRFRCGKTFAACRRLAEPEVLEGGGIALPAFKPTLGRSFAVRPLPFKIRLFRCSEGSSQIPQEAGCHTLRGTGGSRPARVFPFWVYSSIHPWAPVQGRSAVGKIVGSQAGASLPPGGHRGREKAHFGAEEVVCSELPSSLPVPCAPVRENPGELAGAGGSLGAGRAETPHGLGLAAFSVAVGDTRDGQLRCLAWTLSPGGPRGSGRGPSSRVLT